MAKGFESLYLLRYLTIIAVVASLIGSVLMFLIGAKRIIESLIVQFTDINIHTDMQLPMHLDEDGFVTVLVVQAVDTFLFALVLLIFALGIYTLFIMDPEEREQKKIPGWLHINSINQLKSSLASVIIIILFVNVLENIIIVGYESLKWSALIIPITIILLAAALHFLPEH
jgi:uncharacterized membrane protein YqhA